MATWMTIVTGIVVGLLCRRFAAAHPSGAVTDMLLGITGSFAGRSLLDILTRIGVNAESCSWIFVLCGAALLPLSFHGFRRRHDQIQRSKQARISRQGSMVSQQMPGPQAYSTKTRAPAA